jgi:Flp pilus assembly pilin Flp
MNWMESARRILADDEGQDLTEYGLLMFLIAIAAMAVVTEVGSTINAVFWEFIASRVGDL